MNFNTDKVISSGVGLSAILDEGLTRDQLREIVREFDTTRGKTKYDLAEVIVEAIRDGRLYLYIDIDIA